MRAHFSLIALAFGFVTSWGALVPALDAQRPPVAEHPYTAFAPWMKTSPRFVTDVQIPGGPAFQVKIYDWVIGPGREVLVFPLEGSATFQLKAGHVETTINGVKVERHTGDYWVVEKGAKFGIKVTKEGYRGDNMASLRGVVLVRR